MKKVLFVCVENSNRSQMAEAFAHLHGGDTVEAINRRPRPSRCARFPVEARPPADSYRG